MDCFPSKYRVFHQNIYLEVNLRREPQNPYSIMCRKCYNVCIKSGCLLESFLWKGSINVWEAALSGRKEIGNFERRRLKWGEVRQKYTFVKKVLKPEGILQSVCLPPPCTCTTGSMSIGGFEFRKNSGVN